MDLDIPKTQGFLGFGRLGFRRTLLTVNPFGKEVYVMRTHVLWKLLVCISMVIFSVANSAEGAENPWVDVNGYSSLAEAITRIGAGPTTLMVSEVRMVDQNVKIPSNIRLWFTNDGRLNVSARCTVTLLCPISAQLTKIFHGDGIVRFSDLDSGKYPVNDVYPQWWGAHADGTHADETTAAIQAAAIAAKGGVLRFTSGIFLINHQIDLPDKITIAGSGIEKTIIELGTDLKNGEHMFSFVGPENGFPYEQLNIHSVGFHCTGRNHSGGGLAVRFAKRCYFENIQFMRIKGKALFAERLWDSTFINIHCRRCGDDVNGLPTVHITGDEANNASNNLTFFNLTCDYNHWEAMALGEGYPTEGRMVSKLRFQGCKFHGLPTPTYCDNVVLHGAYGIVFENCNFASCGRHHIHIGTGSNYYSQGCVFTGCTINGAGEWGVYINHGAQIMVVNNVFALRSKFKNGSGSIYIGADTKNVQIWPNMSNDDELVSNNSGSNSICGAPLMFRLVEDRRGYTFRNVGNTWNYTYPSFRQVVMFKPFRNPMIRLTAKVSASGNGRKYLELYDFTNDETLAELRDPKYLDERVLGWTGSDVISAYSNWVILERDGPCNVGVRIRMADGEAPENVTIKTVTFETR
jgi:hypothetical protein